MVGKGKEAAGNQILCSLDNSSALDLKLMEMAGWVGFRVNGVRMFKCRVGFLGC